MTHDEIKTASEWPTEHSERVGDCYTIGSRYIAKTPHDSTARLVHGTIYSEAFSKRPICHCVIDMGDGTIWCPVADAMLPLEAFNIFFGLISHVTYDTTEACIEMLKHGHHGPWDEMFWIDGVNIDTLPVEHIEALRAEGARA
jgi:hypothetical protein